MSAEETVQERSQGMSSTEIGAPAGRAGVLKVMSQCAKEAPYAAFVDAQIAVSNTAGAADVKHATAIFAGTHRDVYVVFKDKGHPIDGLCAAVVGIGSAGHRIQVSQGRLGGLIEPVGRCLERALGALAVGRVGAWRDRRGGRHDVLGDLRGGGRLRRRAGYGVCGVEAFAAGASSPRPRCSLYLEGHFTRMWSATKPSSPG